MHLLDPVKEFVLRYYPRQHLVSAVMLSALFVVLLLFSSVDARQNEAIQITEDLTNTLPRPPLTGLPGINAESTAPDSGTVFENISTPDQTVVEPTLLTLIEDLQPTREEVNPLPAPDAWQHLEVTSGDNLSTLFSRVGLSDRELFHVLNSGPEAQVLNRVYPGYQLSFLIPQPGVLEQLRVQKSALEGYVFSLVDGFYEIQNIQLEPEIVPAFKHGSITDSLFMAGQRENIPALTIMEMANIFGGVIDFILDPRIGDHFSILYEEKYLEGEFIGHGDILAAQFTNQGKQYVAVQYKNAEGEIGYYNPDGESMRKAFLRTPLDVFRISSNFSLARRHPILNTIRAHKGTDYAAPKGTPIRATSDGTVSWAGRNGSFGKLVVIKHNGAFETKYAHLNDYANGVKKGKRIRQGDIIGYVGATGSATGPHLHYEFLMNGVHQNPRTILDKLPKAESVSDEEIPVFKAQTTALLNRFSELEEARQMASRQIGAE